MQKYVSNAVSVVTGEESPVSITDTADFFRTLRKALVVAGKDHHPMVQFSIEIEGPPYRSTPRTKAVKSLRRIFNKNNLHKYGISEFNWTIWNEGFGGFFCWYLSVWK